MRRIRPAAVRPARRLRFGQVPAAFTKRSTNGPLRDGQRVRIEFCPPPFDNLGEARDTLAFDPGRIMIGVNTFRGSATDPVRLGTVDDRYIRMFYIEWETVPARFASKVIA